MLMKLNSPFYKFLEGYFQFQEYGKLSCNKSSYVASSSSSNLTVIGLQTLIEISSEEQSNIVILKSTMKRLTTNQISLSSPASKAMETCFLKTCFLCNKNFSLEKDIYMYRGDQGYCSKECRDRQIYLDEMKEIEASTKKITRPNYRFCSSSSSSGRRETRLLMEDLRRRNSPATVTDHQLNHWAIVSFS